MWIAGEVFNEPVSDIRIEGYFTALFDLPIEDVVVAIRYAIAHEKFFPRPVELRNAIHGSPEDRADEAWALTKKEIAKEGRYNRPSLPNMIHQIIKDMGGWRNFCDLDNPEREFLRRYKAAVADNHLTMVYGMLPDPPNFAQIESSQDSGT